MKHNHVELFLLLFILAGCASSITSPDSAQKNISTISDVETWLTNYYMHPRPDFFPAILDVLEKEKVFAKDQNAQAPFVGAFALLFRKQSDSAAAWVSHGESYSSDLKRILWMGLWLSNAPGSMDYLLARHKAATGHDAEYLDVLVNNMPYSLEDLTPVTPENLDTLWGAFFISGQDIYIMNIIKALEYYEQREDPGLFLIAVSAKWSLKSNALRHPRVLMVCRKESAGKSAAAGHLADIVAQVEKRIPWKDEKITGVEILKRDFPLGSFEY